MQARLNDDEMIAAEIEKHGLPEKTDRADIPLTKFTPEVEVMAAVFDKLSEVVSAIYASAGAKSQPRLKPFPRPKTSYDRIEHQLVDDQFLTMIGQLAPHEYDRVAKLINPNT